MRKCLATVTGDVIHIFSDSCILATDLGEANELSTLRTINTRSSYVNILKQKTNKETTESCYSSMENYFGLCALFSVQATENW